MEGSDLEHKDVLFTLKFVKNGNDLVVIARVPSSNTQAPGRILYLSRTIFYAHCLITMNMFNPHPLRQ